MVERRASRCHLLSLHSFGARPQTHFARSTTGQEMGQKPHRSQPISIGKNRLKPCPTGPAELKVQAHSPKVRGFKLRPGYNRISISEVTNAGSSPAPAE
jgi:hypothetical protein